jgi:hypothetical protein
MTNLEYVLIEKEPSKNMYQHRVQYVQTLNMYRHEHAATKKVYQPPTQCTDIEFAASLNMYHY